jgi:tripartite-type tricarboxylate transporter receptor subunit TctC
VKDFDVDAWWAVYVVAGTPKPIIDKLNGWLMQILKQDDTRAFLARFGAEPMPGSPEDFARLLASQTTRWAELIKLANIQPQ